MRREVIWYHGEPYATVYALCCKLGINPNTIWYRMNKYKITAEQAIDGKFEKHTKPKPCTDHKGNKYPSVYAMAKAYGLPRSLVSLRLKLGWSMERTLTQPKRSNSFHVPNKYRDVLIWVLHAVEVVEPIGSAQYAADIQELKKLLEQQE